MLKIRPAQFDALANAHAKSVSARVEAMVAPSYPALRARLGEAELSALVARHVGRAAALGVERLSDVARFVSIACALFPGFEDEPPAFDWAVAILADPDMTPSGKVARLAWWTRRELARAGDGA